MKEAHDRRAKSAARGHGDEIVEIIAGTENIRRARNQQAPHASIRPCIFDRRRHGLVHGQRQRVLFVGPIDPDFPDRAFIDNENIGHLVFRQESGGGGYARLASHAHRACGA